MEVCRHFENKTEKYEDIIRGTVKYERKDDELIVNLSITFFLSDYDEKYGISLGANREDNFNIVIKNGTIEKIFLNEVDLNIKENINSCSESTIFEFEEIGKALEKIDELDETGLVELSDKILYFYFKYEFDIVGSDLDFPTE